MLSHLHRPLGQLKPYLSLRDYLMCFVIFIEGGKKSAICYRCSEEIKKLLDNEVLRKDLTRNWIIDNIADLRINLRYVYIATCT